MENTSGKSREQRIVHTSIIGIAVNLLLSGFKAAVGLVSNSIAIVLDAVNNLSDALSSVVTILGAKLAGRQPDKKHPLGYGRIEYLSAMIVSGLVIYAGIKSGVESVRSILEPEDVIYNWTTFVIMGAAVAGKVLLGRYSQRMGRETDSDSLRAAGKDALFDALISCSVIISAVLYLKFGIRLEGYVGLFISVMIVRSGAGMVSETLDKILGQRLDPVFIREIKETICSVEGVRGAYDLILHNYGPERVLGSVHIEVDDVTTADAIDRMERRITRRVYEKHHVLLAGIGVYSVNTRDPNAVHLRSRIQELVMAHQEVLQMHGFYVDENRKIINLDVILDLNCTGLDEVFEGIRREVAAAVPDYKIIIARDLDI